MHTWFQSGDDQRSGQLVITPPIDKARALVHHKLRVLCTTELQKLWLQVNMLFITCPWSYATQQQISFNLS